LDPARPDLISQEDHLEPIVRQIMRKPHWAYFSEFVGLDSSVEGIVTRDTVHAGRGVFISCPWAIVHGAPTAVHQEEVRNGMTIHSVFLL
jgi:hypothetical protein